jgi:TrmH family RNA methyltransferase
LFIAEGIKVIEELLKSNFELEHLYTSQDDFDDVYLQKKTLVHEVDLKKGFMTPIVVWLYLKYPQRKKVKESGLILALDSVRDPGNLGTILRLCDWFGFEQLLCSKETVDIYNPKVVQATMGSIARVNVYGYKPLFQNTKLPVLVLYGWPEYLQSYFAERRNNYHG